MLRCPPKNLPQENKNNAHLHYNNSVDAWAVGVFAYELVVGFPPFAGMGGGGGRVCGLVVGFPPFAGMEKKGGCAWAVRLFACGLVVGFPPFAGVGVGVFGGER